jgi:acetyl esterase/lipase
MRDWIMLGILLLFCLLLASCSGIPGLTGSRQSHSVKESYTVTRNVVYTPDGWPEPVLGDFFRPRGLAGPAPAVLLVHGGGWTGKDGRWQMEPIARKLAKRGYAVLNVTYRLAPRWIYPSPVEDLQQAVKWIHDHSAELGVDPGRLATFGYSAGGYLASLVAFSENDSRSPIRAVVAGGAPSDLTFYHGGDLVPQFLGGRMHEIPQRFVEASPVNYVSAATPPVFLYHATSDRMVRMEHPNAMMAALKKHSVPYETYWIKGRGHIDGFLLPAGSIDAAMAFLDRYMK